MSLVKCKECGGQVSTKADACPSCGTKPPKQTSIFTWLVFIAIVAFFVLPEFAETNMTPEQRAAGEASRAEELAARQAEQARESELKAQEEIENKRKGFHCLSSWDGSHVAVNRYVQEKMRDPDSFDHIETRITPVDGKGKHTLTMQYRAANGFGGLTVGAATATIDNGTCQATITSLE